MSDIKTIKQALAHATPAPWIYQQGGYGRKSIIHQEHNHDLVCGIAENLDGDGYLIANAPTWLSSLITTIESQQSKMEIDAGFAKVVLAERNLAWHQLESQKEEIERLQKPALSLAYRVLKQKHERDADAFSEYTNGLETQIESLKAITELAVKGLKWYADESNHEIFDGYGERIKSNVDNDDGQKALSTLSEIERLQNGTT